MAPEGPNDMSWNKIRLSEVCSMRTGKLDSNAAVKGGQYPFFTCAQETFQIDKPAFDTEAVLLGGNNAAGIFPLKYYNGQFNAYQRTYVIEALDPQALSTRFLYFALRPALSHFQSASIGAATQYLTKTILDNFKITLPPIEIQHRIGNLLGAYDDLIENNRRRIQLLEQSARMLYKEWFVRLRFPGHEHVKIKDGIPEGWKLGTIADLGNIVTGKTPIKKDESFYGEDIPFIKTPDMHGNTMVVHTQESLSGKGANSQPSKTLPSRSILVSCIGTVGIVSLNAAPAQTNQQINSIVPKAGSLRYWAYFMAKELKPLLEGMGGGATMPNVNKSKFSAIKTVIPPEIILDQFNLYVADQVDQIGHLTLMNLQLIKARDLILPRLMNGEIAV
jgi:type I restriction enzyme, S subunit